MMHVKYEISLCLFGHPAKTCLCSVWEIQDCARTLAATRTTQKAWLCTAAELENVKFSVSVATCSTETTFSIGVCTAVHRKAIRTCYPNLGKNEHAILISERKR